MTIFALNNAHAYSFSEQEINEYLAKQEGIADKFALPGLLSIDYTLHDLVSKIGRTAEKRLELSGLIDGTFQFNRQSFTGKIKLNMDTVPYYDAQKAQIYLKNVRILNWSVQPEKYQSQLQPLMPFLTENLAHLLNSTPIYTFDDSKVKEALIKKFAKGVRVEEGKLELEAGL